MKLGNLAVQLGCDLEGDPDTEIARVAAIEDAGPGDLTFLANAKYASQLRASRASAVIASPDVDGAPCALLRTSNPYLLCDSEDAFVALRTGKQPPRPTRGPR